MTRNEAIKVIRTKYPDLNVKTSHTWWLVRLAEDILKG